MSIRTQANCDRSVADEYRAAYERKLTASLRPRYGSKAAALAAAFNDFTEDRAPASFTDTEREEYHRAARQRFSVRVTEIKRGQS